MAEHLMSDKKLNKLREHQKRLLWLIRGEASTQGWPYPSSDDWADEDRRALEVAIRVNCATETKSDAELFERLESKRQSSLITKAMECLPGPVTLNDARDRALATLKSLAPEQQPATEPDESDDLAFLVYLLDVADILGRLTND